MTITEKFQNKRCVFSIECFPPKQTTQMDKMKATLQAMRALNPDFISVTFGAGGSAGGVSTVEVADYIQHEVGVPALAHLICMGNDQTSAARILDELEQAGVRDVLALRGDIPKGQDIDWETAEFRHAADLVRFAKAHYPDMGIGVAGYPAPHPESPSFASDWRYTVAKIREGADFVITQLFFDVREYLHFVDRLSDMGVSVPVIPGILPIQSLESIRRTLSLCGANIPGKLYLALEEANAKGGAEAVREAGLKFAVQQIRTLLDNGAPGIHLYTLNKASMCLRIAEEVGAL